MVVSGAARTAPEISTNNKSTTRTTLTIEKTQDTIERNRHPVRRPSSDPGVGRGSLHVRSCRSRERRMSSCLTRARRNEECCFGGDAPSAAFGEADRPLAAMVVSGRRRGTTPPSEGNRGNQHSRSCPMTRIGCARDASKAGDVGKDWSRPATQSGNRCLTVTADWCEREGSYPDPNRLHATACRDPGLRGRRQVRNGTTRPLHVQFPGTAPVILQRS